MKKNRVLILIGVICHFSFIVCSHEPAQAAAGPQTELQTVVVDPQNIPMGMIDPNHPSIIQSQRQIHSHVIDQQTQNCARCATGVCFLIALTSALVLLAPQSPGDPKPCVPMAGNNTLSSCWQVNVYACGECTETEESDVQPTPNKNATQAQVVQKVNADLAPICGSAAKICVQAASCPQAWGSNYSSFKGYLNQKCKINPQPAKKQTWAPNIQSKKHFKKKYR